MKEIFELDIFTLIVKKHKLRGNMYNAKISMFKVCIFYVALGPPGALTICVCQ